MTADYNNLADILKDVDKIPVQPEEDINKRIKDEESEKLSSNIEFSKDGSTDIHINWTGDDEIIDFGDEPDSGDDDLIDFGEDDVINFGEDDVIDFGEEIINLEETEPGESLEETEQFDQAKQLREMVDTKETIIPFGETDKTDKENINIKTASGIVFTEEEVDEEESIEIIEEDISEKVIEEEGIKETLLKTTPEISESVEEKMKEIEDRVKGEMSGLEGLMESIRVKTNNPKKIEKEDTEEEVLAWMDEELKKEMEEQSKDGKPELQEENIELPEEEVLEIPKEEEVLEIKEEKVLEIKEEKPEPLLEPDRETKKISEDIKEIKEKLDHTVEEIEGTLNEFSLDGEETKINLSEITMKMIEQKLKNKEKKNQKNLSDSISEVKEKTMDIGNTLENMADNLGDILRLGRVGVDIKSRIITNLIETGKRYFEYDYTTQDYIGNLGIHVEMSEGEKQLYYFKDIPKEYTGYRTVLMDIITELETGIKWKVVHGEVLEIDLMDREYNIDKLTEVEKYEILEFLEANGISYSIKDGIMSVFLDLSEGE